MSGFIAGAVTVGALSAYSTYQGNSEADQRAEDANNANVLAADRSRELARQNSADRKEELLSRFKTTSGKIKDSTQQINMATANKLTNLDMQITTAMSATDNALATKHISGRIADRLRSTQAIQGSLAKGTTVQGAETQTRGVSDKLETLTSDVEEEEMNLDIDLRSTINAANNAEIRGYTYSQSTGTTGVITSSLGGAASGGSFGTSAYNAF